MTPHSDPLIAGASSMPLPIAFSVQVATNTTFATARIVNKDELRGNIVDDTHQIDTLSCHT